MRLRAFAPPDAAFAALLLLIVVLVAFRGLVTVEEGAGFPHGSEVQTRPDPQRGGFLPAKSLRVNPNRADARRLTALPGVGTTLAKAIVRFRETHGPFRRLSDLREVPGIGPKRLQKMLPYLTLGEEATWATK
jgi:competence ComEA-like helix-hairpin-helix protein